MTPADEETTANTSAKRPVDASPPAPAMWPPANAAGSVSPFDSPSDLPSDSPSDPAESSDTKSAVGPAPMPLRATVPTPVLTNVSTPGQAMATPQDPVQAPGVRPLKRRPRAVLMLLLIFAAWIALLLWMYFKTVRGQPG